MKVVDLREEDAGEWVVYNVYLEKERQLHMSYFPIFYSGLELTN